MQRYPLNRHDLKMMMRIVVVFAFCLLLTVQCARYKKLESKGKDGLRLLQRRVLWNKYFVKKPLKYFWIRRQLTDYDKRYLSQKRHNGTKVFYIGQEADKRDRQMLSRKGQFIMKGNHYSFKYRIDEVDGRKQGSMLLCKATDMGNHMKVLMHIALTDEQKEKQNVVFKIVEGAKQTPAGGHFIAQPLGFSQWRKSVALVYPSYRHFSYENAKKIITYHQVQVWTWQLSKALLSVKAAGYAYPVSLVTVEYLMLDGRNDILLFDLGQSEKLAGFPSQPYFKQVGKVVLDIMLKLFPRKLYPSSCPDNNFTYCLDKVQDYFNFNQRKGFEVEMSQEQQRKFLEFVTWCLYSNELGDLENLLEDPFVAGGAQRL